MRKLNRVDKSIFYDLLLLAGQEDKDGVLPSLEDIALELDLKVSDAKKAIDRLLSTGIISKNEDNVLCVTEFTKRQTSNLSEAEKKWNYRNKSRTKKGQVSTDMSDKCPPENTDKKRTSVQKMSTVEEEVEEDIEKEVEEDNTLTKVKVDTVRKSTEKIEKPKLSPDQLEFWKFAKENADFAYRFYLETGIYPVKKEFGRWVNDLRDLAEAEITVEDMKTAVDYMRAKNIPIGAPGSILRTARWLKTNPQSATDNGVQQKRESWTEIAERIAAETGDYGGFNFDGALPEGDVIDL